MLPLFLNTAALAGLIALPSAPVQYRIDYKFSQVMDQTPIGGPVVSTSGAISAFVTLMEKDTLGGKMAEFRFDSVKVITGDSLPPNLAGDASAAKGVMYRSMIVAGKPVGGFKTKQVQPHANLFQSALDAIFPGFKGSAKAGDKWMDTVATSDSVPNIRSLTKVANWTATGVADGTITLDGLVTGTGKTIQPSGEFRLIGDGKISATANMVGTANGAAIRGTLNTKQDIEVTIEGTDATFPVKVVQSVTISRTP